MPFYEYQCENCGHHLEAMQKMAAGPLRKCPACGKSALKRLMSAAAFRLKGGGWYETDFKSEKEDKRNVIQAEKSDAGETATAAKPETPAKGDTAASTAPAAENKPATATPAESPGKAPARVARQKRRTLRRAKVRRR